MGRNFDPSDSGYNEVAARIVEFRTKHPEGSLQPADMAKPFEVVTIGQDTFVVVVAAAYRTADDQRPGIGMAYEVYPGRTPYTRGSELQNAETSAWGRAIVAALAADTKKGIASAEDVRNRQAEQETWEQAAPAQPAAPPQPTPEQTAAFDELAKRAAGAESEPQLRKVWDDTVAAVKATNITAEHGNQLRDALANRRTELAVEAGSDDSEQADEQPAPVEPASGPSEKQHKHMHALWRELGLGGQDNRNERLNAMSLFFEQDINTSNQLTPAEADRLIEHLDRQVKERKGEMVGAAA